MTPEERLRQVADRIRERARSLPAGEAIGADPAPTPCPASDRVPAGKRGAAAAPPRHWAETDAEDDEEETT